MRILNQIKAYSIGAIIAALGVGLSFLIFPDKCITYMSLAVGIGFVVMGIAGVISFLTDRSSRFTLALGVLTFIIGVVICIKYQAIISIIVAIFGVFILVSGVFNALTSIKVIASSLVSGWVTLALSVVTIIFGIIAITKSTQLTQAIVQFIGVALIVYAILDIFAYVQVKKLTRDVKNVVESNNDIETQGTIVEEEIE